MSTPARRRKRVAVIAAGIGALALSGGIAARFEAQESETLRCPSCTYEQAPGAQPPHHCWYCHYEWEDKKDNGEVALSA